MKNLKKKCKIIMLPTGKIANKNELCLNNTMNELFLMTAKIRNAWGNVPGVGEMGEHLRGQHLYITDDSEIKKGDWVYDKTSEELIYQVNVLPVPKEYPWGKIIATTDTSLKTKILDLKNERYVSLPQPSKSFIDKYIAEYNKGNIIEDVLVEYCLRATCDCDFNDMCKCGDMKPMMLPKISKDNTITISKVKNQFSFKEVELILSQFICEECPEYSSKGNGGTYIHNWIKENLEL